MRDRSDIVLTKQLAKGEIAHRLPPEAGEQWVAAVGDLPRLGERSHCERTQRYAVLPPRLHGSPRDDPEALVDIDFRPGGTAHLAAARGRQDEETESQLCTGPGIGVVDDGERLGYVLVGERGLTSSPLRVSSAVGEGGAGGIEGIVGAAALCDGELEYCRQSMLELERGLALRPQVLVPAFETVGLDLQSEAVAASAIAVSSDLRVGLDGADKRRCEFDFSTSEPFLALHHK